jgi:glycine betaine/proline transport system permease protein
LVAIEQWIASHQIPVGPWAVWVVDVVKTDAAGFFNVVSTVLSFLLDGTANLLTIIPGPLLILIFMAMVWFVRKSWKLTLFVGLALLFVMNQGYWHDTVLTLSLILYATLFCMIIGVPLGIAAAHRPWLYRLLRPILDLMQTLPTFVYLIPTLVLFGLGSVPGLISAIVFVLPTPVRLTYLGISSVPRPLIEAGEAFGATKRQLLLKVELRAALPTIMAGFTQVIMLSLSMVVIAALVGAGGLGEPVVDAMETVQIGRGFTSGLAIVILAVILDRVFRPAEEKSSRT